MSEVTIVRAGGVAMPGSSSITIAPVPIGTLPDIIKIGLSDKHKRVKVTWRLTDRSEYVLVTVNANTTVIVE